MRYAVEVTKSETTERMNRFTGATDLWPAKAVKATFVIRRVRVAEIKWNTDEGVGLESSPDGIEQIRRGFRDDGQITGTSDSESEMVILQPEVAVTGLNVRIP